MDDEAFEEAVAALSRNSGNDVDDHRAARAVPIDRLRRFPIAAIKQFAAGRNGHGTRTTHQHGKPLDRGWSMNGSNLTDFGGRLVRGPGFTPARLAPVHCLFSSILDYGTSTPSGALPKSGLDLGWLRAEQTPGRQGGKLQVSEAGPQYDRR